MSKTVDERIVSMQFDNRQFERNVQTSMSTLSKLKQSLNLSGAAKGLDGIRTAANKFDISPMGQGVDSVKAKFSALQVMAVTTLANITNSAVNYGKRIASALTIDPIKTGFQEYETQINAVQTILANTQSKGSTLNDVNAALDELNTYADKTIYNFTEMTRNIGTFTAAGVDLNTSVQSIKGIANLAAVSGSTSQQASTAMYQLSQALASGKVQLQDWNSVVNAGMGGQVFQDALKRTATTMGTNVDAMIDKYGSFRESLTQGGWLTTEVLTETLKQFSGAYTEADLIQQGYSESQAKEIMQMAETAVDAATKVKTFTQLFDTLKEAAQSGWTQSWEVIVGDFDEAKSLLTSISDTVGEMINKSAEARNELLKGWKDLGGRTKLIEGFKNAFDGLLSIVKPVKEAFREIFPAMTSKQLYYITKGFATLTSHLILSENTSNNLKRTLKGLFAVLDIVVMVVKDVVGGFTKLISKFTGAGSGILGMTGSLGDWLVALRDAIKSNDLFGKAIDFLVNVIGKVISVIGGCVIPLKNWVSSLRNSARENEAFGKSIEKISEFLQKAKDNISDFVDFVKGKFKMPEADTVINSLVTGMQKLWDILKKVGSKITSVFSAINKTVGEMFKSGSMSGAVDVVNGGIFAVILLEISKLLKFVNNLTTSDPAGLLDKILGSIGDKISSITGILDSVRDSLKTWQQSLKIDMLLKIAGAIAILTASIFVLSRIDSEKLASSLTAITILFGDLMGAMAIFNQFSGAKSIKASLSMIAMSVSVLILAGALKKLSKIDADGLMKGIIGVAALSAIIVVTAKELSKNTGKVMKGALNVVIFSTAIKILASAVKSMSSLSWEEMAKGLVGVGVLMGEVALFLNNAKFSLKAKSTAAGILILSVALKILASACKSMASMSWEEMARGLVGVGVLLAELMAFTHFTADAKHVISTATGLAILGVAMKILASAVKSFSGMGWEELARGLVGMGGALAAVTIALNFIPNSTIIKAAGLVVVAGALAILSNVLKSMGGMSWIEIAKGLVTLGGSLALLAIGLEAMSGTLAGSAALMVSAIALRIMVPVLQALGSMSWGEIAKGLLTLAGALAIIGVAGAVLAPVIPAILGLAGALALIGLAALGIGAGLFLAASGLTALAIAGTAAATSIVASITIIIAGILNLIPTIIEIIKNTLLGICQVIIEGAPAIGSAIKALVLMLVDVLVTCIPNIVNGAMQLLVALLNAIIEYGPVLIQQVIDIIMLILQAVRDNIQPITTIIVDIITGILTTISEQLPRIIQAGIDIIVNLINGLAQGIEENAPRIKDAFINLFKSLLDAVLELFGIHSPSTVFADIGMNIILGLINGIQNFGSQAIDAITGLMSKLIQGVSSKTHEFLAKGGELISNLKNGISNKVGEVKAAATQVVSNAITAISSKRNEFLSKGRDLISNLKNGISNKMSDVKSAVTKVVSNSLSGARSKISDFKTVGKNMISGLVNGIKEKANKAVSAAKGVVSDALKAAKNLLGIKSPSRAFAEVGKYSDLGLVVGLKKFSGNVSEAASNVGSLAVNSMQKSISRVSDLANSNVDIQPTIRPVIDTTSISAKNIQLGANIDSLISKPVDSLSQIIQNAQANINASNNNVISAINNLREDLNMLLTDDEKEISLYVDSKKLATSLAKPIDRQLSVLAKRGAY